MWVINNAYTSWLGIDSGSSFNYHTQELTLPDVNVSVDCALVKYHLHPLTAGTEPYAYAGIARIEHALGIEQWAWEPTGLVPAAYEANTTSVTVGVGAQHADARMRYRLLYWEWQGEV